MRVQFPMGSLEHTAWTKKDLTIPDVTNPNPRTVEYCSLRIKRWVIGVLMVDYCLILFTFVYIRVWERGRMHPTFNLGTWGAIPACVLLTNTSMGTAQRLAYYLDHTARTQQKHIKPLRSFALVLAAYYTPRCHQQAEHGVDQHSSHNIPLYILVLSFVYLPRIPMSEQGHS